MRLRWLLLVPVLLAVAGCGGTGSTGSSSGPITIAPGTATIDTNCTGCVDSSGQPSSYEQFTAISSGGGAASVNWTLSGGDAKSGPGAITSSGQYTPPGYLTADSVKVTVTAALVSNPSETASATITVTPGFLQPLSPENVALGADGTVKVTGYIAEAGGTASINYTTSSSPTGSGGGQGTLVSIPCTHSSTAFTSCPVTYTAPSVISSTGAMYIVGTIGTSSSKASTEVLLNTAGVDSSPLSHENVQIGAINLGTSGGNNKDYDTAVRNGQTVITDCCGGTLGALLKDNGGNYYILSNNHVLARSDQALPGEAIIQPGLIDDNCSPYPNGASTQVATLTNFLPLNSSSTNADAAIAKIMPGAVNTNGDILELGPKNLSTDELSPAPPGITCSIASTSAGVPTGASCTPGGGETAVVGMVVAKSGRTTGLTCAAISTVSLNVKVSYFKNCGETVPYLTKEYTNQIGITGNQFSNAGDSGSLVVDTSNAEPVGLFFAGGVDSSGQSEGVANPAGTVLQELDAHDGATYTFVGGADHQVSCLNYGAGTVAIAQSAKLTTPQIQLAQAALAPARNLVNPSTGILGVATGKSSDDPGTPAVLVYLSPTSTATVPATINGVRTVVIRTTASAVATGTAPTNPFHGVSVPPLSAAVVKQAIAIKQRIAQSLMQKNPAFFGVGIGQSYDDPSQAALVIYVDRNDVPATLPPTMDGLRTRYIIMSRLHVTRAYLSPIPTRSRCSIRATQPGGSKLIDLKQPLKLP